MKLPWNSDHTWYLLVLNTVLGRGRGPRGKVVCIDAPAERLLFSGLPLPLPRPAQTEGQALGPVDRALGISMLFKP